MKLFDRGTFTTSLLGLVFGALMLASGAVSAQIYVDHLATGANDGSSWEDAFTDLQDALAQANGPGGGEIWVARGTYTPTDGSDRTISFLIEFDNVRLYGGFAGTETSREQRDWLANATILSGQIGNPSQSDNSHSVLYLDGRTSAGTTITDETVVDGFLITRGYASGGQIIGGGLMCNGEGSGNECSPRLSNLVIHENVADFAGGGMISLGWDGGKSNPVLTNVVFQGNTAGNGGGLVNMAQNNGESSPQLTNVTFTANEADSGSGGGLYNWADNGGASNPTLTNVLFAGNRADDQGGGLINRGGTGGDTGVSSPVLINTTFSGNIASVGGGVANSGGGSAEFINSVFWNNQATAFAHEIYNSGAQPSFAYSLIRNSGGSGGGWDSNLGIDGGNNLDADPQFIEAIDPATAPTTLGNLRPQNGSPIINSGQNSAVPSGINQDLDGNPRIHAGTVDRGAYEDQPQPVRTYVDHAATGANTGLSWANAFTDLQAALSIAHSLHGRGEIWVAQGTYRPTTSSDRTISFRIQNDGIELYGGFAGHESSRDARNWRVNPTVLSGDINEMGGNLFGNTFHVVYLDGQSSAYGGRGYPLTARTVIDGFTIRQGSADQPSFLRGAGLYCNGRFPGGECSPILNNLIFSQNIAANSGGAIKMVSTQSERTSRPRLTNVLFSGNRSHFGGAVRIETGPDGRMAPQFINVTFAGNYASMAGGAITTMRGSNSIFEPEFVNTIFWGNEATESATNQINKGENAAPIFFHTLIQGSGASGSGWNTNLGIDGGNNIDADPLFISPLDPSDAPIYGGNYRVQTGSPAINGGTNSVLPDDIVRDLDANDRINQGVVDIGAYEWYEPPEVIYVHQSATGANTGTSWEDAYTDLQNALADAHAQGGAEIWVAAGTYRPTAGTDRSISFTIRRDNIRLYGGFAGWETSREQRSWRTNSTTLSGDIGQQDDHSDNSWNVVLLDGTVANGTTITTSTVIDGFTIAHGNGIGAADSRGSGGGVLCLATETGAVCSPLIRNVVVKSNRAGMAAGIYNNALRGNSSPILQNVEFRGNQTTAGCAAIYNYGRIGGTSNPELINVLVSGNASTPGTNDAVVCSTGQHKNGVSNPHFLNVTVAGNTGGISTAAYLGGSAHVSISNSTLYGNGNGSLFRQFNWAGDAQISVDASIIQNGGHIVGAIDVDPQFLDPLDSWPSTNGDYRTSYCSPARNAGNPDTELDAFPGGPENPYDLLNLPRVRDGVIDIGPYEHQSPDSYSIGGTVSGLLGGLLRIQNQVGEIIEINSDGGFAFQPQADCSHYEVTILTNPQDPPQHCEVKNSSGTIQGAPITDIVVACILDASEAIVFVDQNATGLENGSSWEHAFTNLQDALALVNSAGEGEIWVAAGVYKPTDDGDRSISFEIRHNNIRLYGGFSGNEETRDQRDWLLNETVLSGDIGASGDVDDNSFHVIRMDGTTNNGSRIDRSTVIDGFVISGGNANEGDPSGGGIFCYIWPDTTGGDCSPSLRNLTFINNSAGSQGGGIYIQTLNNTAGPLIEDSIFENNSAVLGGAISVNSRLTLRNVQILSNEASSGGGLNVFTSEGESEIVLENVSFVGNQSASCPAIRGFMLSQVTKWTVSHSIFKGNFSEIWGGGSVCLVGIDSPVTTIKMQNSVFKENIAAGDGGALWLGANASELLVNIVNVSIFGNDSSGRGGGIYSATSNGGSVALSVVNSILFGNLGAEVGDQFYLSGDTTANLSYSLVEGSGGSGENWDQDIGVDGGGNIDADPLFVDPASGNLRLRHGSPAIDAGDNEAVADIEFDLDGNPRINGSAVDMGAYEWFEKVFSDRFEN